MRPPFFRTSRWPSTRIAVQADGCCRDRRAFRSCRGRASRWPDGWRSSPCYPCPGARSSIAPGQRTPSRSSSASSWKPALLPGYNARSSWRKIIMPSRHLDSESLTRRLKDRQVSQALVKGAYELILRFSDGTVLHVEASSQLLTRVEDAVTPEAPDAAERPTKRQLEYLAFIAKYMDRFGRAPAESDIQRHFLVSAPSVNQMMQMLERRGFITRLPGVPRSIRICIDLAAGAR